MTVQLTPIAKCRTAVGVAPLFRALNAARIRRAVVPVVLVLALAGCKSPPAEVATEAPTAHEDLRSPSEEAMGDLVGHATREDVEKYPGFAASDASGVVTEDAKALAAVPPGAKVAIYLGTWCGDSRREVSRFFRAIDVAGDVPFTVAYIGLDRKFSAGDVELEGKEIEAVPTFVVMREGAELGRVVETSVDGIETDLAAILNGTKTGKVSATR